MNVIIVDDDRLVCSALQTIVEAGGIRVAGIGFSGQEAVVLYEEHHPDIVLMDIRMKDMTGLDAAGMILDRDSAAKILFLTTFADDEYMVRALKMGAKGYLLKQDFESIVPALTSVNVGQSIFGGEIVSKIPKMMHTTGKRQKTQRRSFPSGRKTFWCWWPKGSATGKLPPGLSQRGDDPQSY